MARPLAGFRPAAPYDVAVLSNVLEHALDPAEMLRQVRRILTPDGEVWISCPNAASWLRRLFGRRWINWHAPFHIVHFTDATLSKTLEAGGFDSVARDQATPALWVAHSILAGLTARRGEPTRSLRKPLLVMLLMALARGVMFPLLWLGNSHRSRRLPVARRAPRRMKIAFHDYPGHAFPVQLSRALARRGHTVLHLYFADFQSPKGRLAAGGGRSTGPAPAADRARPAASQIRSGAALAAGPPLCRTARRAGPRVRARRRARRQQPARSASAAARRGARRRRRLRVLAAGCLRDRDRPAAAAQAARPGRAGRRALSRLERRLWRGSDAIVAITEDFRPMLDAAGIDPARVAVIENWAALDELPQRPARQCLGDGARARRQARTALCRHDGAQARSRAAVPSGAPVSRCRRHPRRGRLRRQSAPTTSLASRPPRGSTIWCCCRSSPYAALPDLVADRRRAAGRARGRCGGLFGALEAAHLSVRRPCHPGRDAARQSGDPDRRAGPAPGWSPRPTT
ncbi:MAG: methyltransferase domain-containing protein [Pseudomonadota bacterium]